MSIPSRATAMALFGAGLQLIAAGSLGESPGLGQAVDAETLAGIDLVIDASGTDLPEGEGRAADGEAIYAEKCLGCHGIKGEGQIPLLRLAGGNLRAENGPVTTVGNYWPYATTLFDYIRRAMPASAPKSLTTDEVYATAAYVLFLNGLVGRDTVIDRNSLPAIAMPNRDGFIDFSAVIDQVEYGNNGLP